MFYFFRYLPRSITSANYHGEQLYEAMCQLPEKSARRIYAHYFLGMSKIAIARAEHVDERAVRKSIQRGLKQMESLLKNI
ncbi:hypothetical protein LJK88_04090 [Paenibacillus sp. P26]|nr:hypothetical protein LJK88_04090 [Paenibacillus sp. P26]